MVVAEVALIAIAIMVVGLCGSIAYLISIQLKEQGINERAKLRAGVNNPLGNSPIHSPGGQWWELALVELLKNPQIMELLSKFAVEKLAKK